MSITEQLDKLKEETIRLRKKMSGIKVYSGIDKLPSGRASDEITEGCLCLEGGAWKGVYTVGVLDALMVHGINFRSVVGISAGGLSGLGYVTGQIGLSARVDLTYRHDSNYCGIKAYKKNHGITGFSYLYNEILKKDTPLDRKRLKETPRRFAVGATNMLTGKIEYFEKGKCANLSAAVRASATVPFLSRPVVMHGVPYLDGGCSIRIPYDWAQASGERKIIVVKTREREFRRGKDGSTRLANQLYRNYPNFVESLSHQNKDFNELCEQIYSDETLGKTFVIAPSEKVEVSRFEGDMEKLGNHYWLGYHDMEARLDDLKAYLAN